MQADIGLGLLLSILISSLFHIEPSVWLILFCIGAALLPDIDFLIEFGKHGNIAGKEIREHRELLHFPITYIPLAILLWFVFGPIWGVALGLGILSHFLHDSVGIGFGVPWLWPLSTDNYKFFAGQSGHVSWNFFQSWRKEEMPALANEHGLENWVRDVYLKPFPIRVPMWLFYMNLIEWVVFVVGAVSLYLYLV